VFDGRKSQKGGLFMQLQCCGNVRLRELVLNFGFKSSLIELEQKPVFSRSD